MGEANVIVGTVLEAEARPWSQAPRGRDPDAASVSLSRRFHSINAATVGYRASRLGSMSGRRGSCSGEPTDRSRRGMMDRDPRGHGRKA